MKRGKDPAMEEELEREVREAQAGVRRYITRKAAAWYLGMHPHTLSNLQTAGAGPPMVIRSPAKRSNVRQLYTLADLDDWLASRRVTSYGSRERMVVLDALRREEQLMHLEGEIARLQAKLLRLQKRSDKESFRRPKTAKKP
jgi:hypothetical protein